MRSEGLSKKQRTFTSGTKAQRKKETSALMIQQSLLIATYGTATSWGCFREEHGIEEALLPRLIENMK